MATCSPEDCIERYRYAAAVSYAIALPKKGQAPCDYPILFPEETLEKLRHGTAVASNEDALTLLEGRHQGA